MKTAVLLSLVVLASSTHEAHAGTLPVNYVVEYKALKKEVPPGTDLLFELFEGDPTCTDTPVATQLAKIEDIELRELVKPTKLRGNPDKPATATRLNLVLSGVSLSPGADLYLKVTRADFGPGLSPIGTACQSQGISPGDGDVLGGLSCAPGEIAKFDGNAWGCAADDEATGALSCTVVAQTQTIPSGSAGFSGAICQSPSLLTGGGVLQLGSPLSADVKILSSGPSDTPNLWACVVRNDSAIARDVSCRAVCCTVEP